MTSNTENYNKLRAFFNEEYHSLKTYARSRINDAADRNADDIVQDVALKIFSRADSATPIDNIAAFVYNSIRNRVIDLMRTKRSRVDLEDDMETRFMEFTQLFYEKSDNAYSETMKNELKKAILTLRPGYREIIIAIDFEGFTYKEISMETGIPSGTLMSRRHRALSVLHKKLETKKENSN